MKDNFEKALDFVLKWETGNGRTIFTNYPNDPGGKTKYGISQRSHPNVDIENLTLDGAKAIFRDDYWDDCGCDNIPYPLDIAVFNLAVTSGKGASLKRLRESNGFCDYILHTIKFYVDIKGAVLEGWLNRAFDLYEQFGDMKGIGTQG